MNARIATTLAAAAVLGAALGHCRGLRSGMAIGYAYGDRDGHRRGDAKARLDMVLDGPAVAEPTEAEHYAAIVSALPDAGDSAAFWDAVRMDTVRRSVQGREEWS